MRVCRCQLRHVSVIKHFSMLVADDQLPISQVSDLFP